MAHFPPPRSAGRARWPGRAASALVAGAAAILVAGGGCGDPAGSAAVQRLVREGLERLGRGDEEGAEAVLVRAVAADPGSAEAHHALGRARLERSLVQLSAPAVDRDLLRSALASLERARRLDPTAAEHHLREGIALARMHEADAAAARLEEALARAPGLAEARLQLGLVRRLQARPEEAEAELARAAALAPESPGAYLQLGLVRLELADWEGARAALARAVELDPGRAEPWFGLATALRRLGRTAEADEALASFEARKDALAGPAPGGPRGTTRR